MPYKLLAKFKIPLIFCGLIFLSFLLSNYKKETNFDQFFFGSQNKTHKINQQKKETIQNLLNSNLSNEQKEYAVFIKDLKSGETYELESDKSFNSASIYKLAVMYKAYDSLDKGELDKKEVLIGNKSKLDTILAGENKQNKKTYESTVVSQSVEEALRLMITISDNYSALLLAQKLGWDQIDEFLKAQGIENFNLTGKNAPNATARSTGQILENIYKGKAVSPQASAQMKTLLLAQSVNNRIPKYLPVDIKVAHKTGELDSLRHDASIVFGKKSDYVFVFFSDTKNPESASETIAKLSLEIFNALENQQKP